MVPIILGSNKTTVSVATGQTDYYPLYLSIRNVHSTVHRAHCNAVALIGFLAMPKSGLYLFVTDQFSFSYLITSCLIVRSILSAHLILQ